MAAMPAATKVYATTRMGQRRQYEARAVKEWHATNR